MLWETKTVQSGINCVSDMHFKEPVIGELRQSFLHLHVATLWQNEKAYSDTNLITFWWLPQFVL